MRVATRSRTWFAENNIDVQTCYSIKRRSTNLMVYYTVDYRWRQRFLSEPKNYFKKRSITLCCINPPSMYLFIYLFIYLAWLFLYFFGMCLSFVPCFFSVLYSLKTVFFIASLSFAVSTCYCVSIFSFLVCRGFFIRHSFIHSFIYINSDYTH